MIYSPLLYPTTQGRISLNTTCSHFFIWMQHCSNYLRTITQKHSPFAHKSQWGPLLGQKGRKISRKSIKKVFCFELCRSPDFMLVISFFLTIYLDFYRLHLGQGKEKIRVGASLKTFSSSTQPTKEETLAWWNELEDRHFTGCAAWLCLTMCHQLSHWTNSSNVPLPVSLIHSDMV